MRSYLGSAAAPVHINWETPSSIASHALPAARRILPIICLQRQHGAVPTRTRAPGPALLTAPPPRPHPPTAASLFPEPHAERRDAAPPPASSGLDNGTDDSRHDRHRSPRIRLAFYACVRPWRADMHRGLVCHNEEDRAGFGLEGPGVWKTWGRARPWSRCRTAASGVEFIDVNRRYVRRKHHPLRI